MSFDMQPGSKNKVVFIKIRNYKKSTVRGIRQGFYFLGRDLRSTANANILKTPRSGREEVFRGRRRRASIAGESFANRTGDARRQLGFDVRGSNQLEFGFRQNRKTAYVIDLEFEKDRPTIEIAARANFRNAQKHMEREINKAQKKGRK